MARLNYERAATVLAEAAVLGDDTAVKRHGMSLRTLYRYRNRLAEDDKLAQLVSHKRAILEREWADELAPAIREQIAFLRRAAQSVDPKDPDAIHAVAGALKILSEVSLTKEVLDARLATASRPNDQAPGALVAARA